MGRCGDADGGRLGRQLISVTKFGTSCRKMTCLVMNENEDIFPKCFMIKPRQSFSGKSVHNQPSICHLLTDLKLRCSFILDIEFEV